MKQNIVEIQVTEGFPEAPQETQGGVMYEHNATALRFLLDPVYIAPEYRYYLEFVTVNGVNRTDYLTPDEENAIEFSIPADITSQMTALCCLNIVAVNEAGKTEQLIKSKSVNLYFSVFENTEKKLAADYAFSVNALLEAIKNGTFKGDKGDPGEKGDAEVTIDETVTADSQNPVSSAGIYAFTRAGTERKIAHRQVVGAEEYQSLVIEQDTEGNAFSLGSVTLYGRLIFAPQSERALISVTYNSGNGWLLYGEFAASSWMVDMVIRARASGVLVSTVGLYGFVSQGKDACDMKPSLAAGVSRGIESIEIALQDAESGERLPLLEGSDILITGYDFIQ